MDKRHGIIHNIVFASVAPAGWSIAFTIIFIMMFNIFILRGQWTFAIIAFVVGLFSGLIAISHNIRDNSEIGK